MPDEQDDNLNDTDPKSAELQGDGREMSPSELKALIREAKALDDEFDRMDREVEEQHKARRRSLRSMEKSWGLNHGEWGLKKPRRSDLKAPKYYPRSHYAMFPDDGGDKKPPSYNKRYIETGIVFDRWHAREDQRARREMRLAEERKRVPTPDTETVWEDGLDDRVKSVVPTSPFQIAFMNEVLSLYSETLELDVGALNQSQRQAVLDRLMPIARSLESFFRQGHLYENTARQLISKRAGEDVIAEAIHGAFWSVADKFGLISGDGPQSGNVRSSKAASFQRPQKQPDQRSADKVITEVPERLKVAQVFEVRKKVPKKPKPKSEPEAQLARKTQPKSESKHEIKVEEKPELKTEPKPKPDVKPKPKPETRWKPPSSGIDAYRNIARIIPKDPHEKMASKKRTKPRVQKKKSAGTSSSLNGGHQNGAFNGSAKISHAPSPIQKKRVRTNKPLTKTEENRILMAALSTPEKRAEFYAARENLYAALGMNYYELHGRISDDVAKQMSREGDSRNVTHAISDVETYRGYHRRLPEDFLDRLWGVRDVLGFPEGLDYDEFIRLGQNFLALVYVPENENERLTSLSLSERYGGHSRTFAWHLQNERNKMMRNATTPADEETVNRKIGVRLIDGRLEAITADPVLAEMFYKKTAGYWQGKGYLVTSDVGMCFLNKKTARGKDVVMITERLDDIITKTCEILEERGRLNDQNRQAIREKMRGDIELTTGKTSFYYSRGLCEVAESQRILVKKTLDIRALQKNRGNKDGKSYIHEAYLHAVRVSANILADQIEMDGQTQKLAAVPQLVPLPQKAKALKKQKTPKTKTVPKKKKTKKKKKDKSLKKPERVLPDKKAETEKPNSTPESNPKSKSASNTGPTKPQNNGRLPRTFPVKGPNETTLKFEEFSKQQNGAGAIFSPVQAQWLRAARVSRANALGMRCSLGDARVELGPIEEKLQESFRRANSVLDDGDVDLTSPLALEVLENALDMQNPNDRAVLDGLSMAYPQDERRFALS